MREVVGCNDAECKLVGEIVDELVLGRVNSPVKDLRTNQAQ